MSKPMKSDSYSADASRFPAQDKALSSNSVRIILRSRNAPEYVLDLFCIKCLQFSRGKYIFVWIKSEASFRESHRNDALDKTDPHKKT